MKVSGGLHLSERSGALYMSESGVLSYGTPTSLITPAPPPDYYAVAPWAPWGANLNNQQPAAMKDDIENCGILQSALTTKAELAIGKGPRPYLLTNIKDDGTEELDYVDDAEIADWQEANDTYHWALDTAYDDISGGWCTGSYIRDVNTKQITNMRRIDVFNARMQKMNPSNNAINSIFISNDWTKVTNLFDENYIVRIPALREGFELSDLKNRNYSGEYAYIRRRKRNSQVYYPQAGWLSAEDWIKIVRSIPAFKKALFTNSITLKYIIRISPKYFESEYGSEVWEEFTDDKRKAAIEAKYDEIDTWLTGNDKAYKTLITGSFFDNITGKDVPFITVEVIDDKVKDGKFLPDSSAGASEILFSLKVNPALIGAGQPGGPYSNNAGGSNIRESYLTQVMMLQPVRENISYILNVVKNYNGWADRLEKAPPKVMAVTAPPPPPNTPAKKNDAPAVDPQAAPAQPPAPLKKPRLVWRFPLLMLTTLDTGKSTKSQTL